LRIPWIAVLSFACLGAGASRASAQTAMDVLTLERAVEIAVAANRPLQSSRLEEQRSRDDLATLATRRRPAFDLRAMGGGFITPFQFSFREGAFGTFPSTGPIPSTDVVIEPPRSLSSAVLFTAVQPLTQLRKISRGQAVLALGADVAAEQTKQRQQALVTDVRRVYYGLTQVGAGLAAMREALIQLDEFDRVVTQYLEAEVALPRDRLSVRAERARVVNEQLRLTNLQATLTERLNLLLGRDLTTPFVVAGPPAPALDLMDIESAVARARAANPAVRQAELNVQRAVQDSRLKAAERMPDVSLSFSYLRLFNMAVLPRTTASASLLFNWEPFDWGRNRLDMATRERTLAQARIGLEEAQALVELDIRAKFRAVAEAREAVNVAQLTREAAAEDLRVVTERYRVEAALFKDVLEAHTATLRTAQAHEQALGAFWTARAELDQAIGDTP